MTVSRSRSAFTPLRRVSSTSVIVTSLMAIAGFAISIGYLYQVPLRASTISAATCAYQDVINAINNSKDGDTITIPAGTCTWSTELWFTKSVIVKGAGIDVTIIKAGSSDLNGYLVNWSDAAPATFELSGVTINGSDQSGCLFLHNGSGG